MSGPGVSRLASNRTTIGDHVRGEIDNETRDDFIDDVSLVERGEERVPNCEIDQS
jgi:hypothetical protein